MNYDIVALKSQQDYHDARVTELRAKVDAFVDAFVDELNAFVDAAIAGDLRGMSKPSKRSTPNGATAYRFALFNIPVIAIVTPSAALEATDILSFRMYIYGDVPEPANEFPWVDAILAGGSKPRIELLAYDNELQPVRINFHPEFSEQGAHEFAHWLIHRVSGFRPVWLKVLKKSDLLEQPAVGMTRPIGFGP